MRKKVSQGLGCLHSAPTRGCWACERDFPELVKPVPAPAEPAQEIESRSSLKRKAVMRGEKMPTFAAEPVAGASALSQGRNLLGEPWSPYPAISAEQHKRQEELLKPAPSVAVPEGEAKPFMQELSENPAPPSLEIDSDQMRDQLKLAKRQIRALNVEVDTLRRDCVRLSSKTVDCPNCGFPSISCHEAGGELRQKAEEQIRNHAQPIWATPPTNPVSTAGMTAEEFWGNWQKLENRTHHTIDDWPVRLLEAFAAHVLAEKGKR